MYYNTTINHTSPLSMFKKRSDSKPVKYRTIRVREEVALQLDEWRDLFEDASMSEVMWRVFSLARRELKRVKDKKKEVNEKFVSERKPFEKLSDIVSQIPEDGVE